MKHADRTNWYGTRARISLPAHYSSCTVAAIYEVRTEYRRVWWLATRYSYYLTRVVHAAGHFLLKLTDRAIERTASLCTHWLHATLAFYYCQVHKDFQLWCGHAAYIALRRELFFFFMHAMRAPQRMPNARNARHTERMRTARTVPWHIRLPRAFQQLQASNSR